MIHPANKPLLQSFLLLSALLIFTQCKKDTADNDLPGISSGMDGLIIERLFNWSLTREVAVRITALDGNGHPIPHVRFDIYQGSVQSPGERTFAGATDSTGVFVTNMVFPMDAEKAVVKTFSQGTAVVREVTISDNALITVFEGLERDTTTDSDWDYIPDAFDDYPADTAQSFNNYFPSENHFATLVFNDSWPGESNYDYNDVVIRYRCNYITNFFNQVVEVDITLVQEAAGSTRHNGFGIQFRLDPSLFDTVSGSRLTTGTIHTELKGYESVPGTMIVIAYDDGRSLFEGGDLPGPVNTVPGVAYRKPDTLSLRIVLPENQSIPVIMFGLPPFNPFIFTDGDRSHEIHLPDHPPTALADTTLFGTLSDNSQPLIFRYYKNRNNLPWALHFPGEFSYLTEGSALIRGYPKFGGWTESDGSAYRDWYYKEGQGYRNEGYLYSH
ncbi:MAG TPA: LruC domain-containing protein [Bacteroidales bacterium]|nr:LruC domain-containing protein [Bacteroidales bacterium]HPT10347.1 LruC domain-containing protein [Bacteroidales bacterium]